MSFTLLRIKMAANAFSTLPAGLWGPLARARLLAPYYHLVSDEDVPHVKHLYPFKGTRQFIRDLDFLLRQYEPLSLYDLLDRIRKGLPVSRKFFFLTFDDGFREMYDIVAPILLGKGIPATFFISSAFIDNKALCHDHKKSLLIERLQRGISEPERQRIDNILASAGIGRLNTAMGLRSVPYDRRAVLDDAAAVLSLDFQEYLVRRMPYLTSAQARTMIEQGFCVGGHSIDHPPFSMISIGEQVRQSVESVRFMKEKFHLTYGVFAFPYSDRGITGEFFARLGATGAVEACFGTNGLMDEARSDMLQRISLEQTMMPAEKIIAYQYARRCFKRLTGNGATVRR